MLASLRSLTFLNCGFNSRRGHGCLSVTNVVRCRVEASTKGPIIRPGEFIDYVVSLSVNKNLKSEAALACVGLLCQKKKSCDCMENSI